MKTILRFLAIVLAITAVAGVTYALAQSESVTQQLGLQGESGHESGRSRPEGGDAGFERSERPEAGGERGGHDGEHSDGFNISAVTEFAKTLLPITLVIAAVALFNKGMLWAKRRRKNLPPPETAVS